MVLQLDELSLKMDLLAIEGVDTTSLCLFGVARVCWEHGLPSKSKGKSKTVIENPHGNPFVIVHNEFFFNLNSWLKFTFLLQGKVFLLQLL